MTAEYVDRGYVVARILMWVCLILAVVVPILYHHRSNGTWSFTPVGRHIMQWNVLFALLMLFSVISVFVPASVTVTASIILFSVTSAIIVNQIRFLMNPRAMDPQDFLERDPSTTAPMCRVLTREETLVKSRPVVIAMSILATLQFVFGGLVTLNLPGNGMDETVLAIGAFGTLAVAAAQYGVQFYVQNLVTPHEDVAAFRDKYGEIVAGPAAPPEGENVAVVADDEPGAHRAR